MKNNQLKKAIILFSCVAFSACSSQTPATTTMEKLDSKTIITNQINDLVNKGRISKDEQVSVIKVGDTDASFLAKIDFKEGFKTKANVNGTSQSLASDIDNIDLYLLELSAAPNLGTDPLGTGNVIISKMNLVKPTTAISSTSGVVNVLFSGLPKNATGKQYYVGVVAKKGSSVINKPPLTPWIGLTSTSEPALTFTSTGVGVSEVPVSGVNILQVSTPTALTISLSLLDAIGAVVSTNVTVNNGSPVGSTYTGSVNATPELSVIGGGGLTPPSSSPTSAFSVSLSNPSGITKNNSTGVIYIADTNNHTIDKLDTNGNITIFAGGISSPPSTNPQAATGVRLNQPTGISLDSLGNLYIADSGDNYIEKVDTNGNLTIIAGAGAIGSGSPTIALKNANTIQLNKPTQVIADTGVGNNLYIVENGANLIEKIDTNNNISIIAGNSTGISPSTIAQLAANVKLNNPGQIAVDNLGTIYIADTDNGYIEKLAIVNSAETLTVIAGKTLGLVPTTTNQLATSVLLDKPYGIASDSSNSGNIYITSKSSKYIELINTVGNLRIIAGNNTGTALTPKTYQQIATNVKLNIPSAIFVDNLTNLYLVDSGDNLIEKVIGVL